MHLIGYAFGAINFMILSFVVYRRWNLHKQKKEQLKAKAERDKRMVEATEKEGLKGFFFFLLNEKLSPFGFVHVKSKNGFVKKEQGNEFTIKFEAWPYFAMIEPSYGAYIKEIEEVKKKAWGKEYSKHYSLGHTRSYILESSDFSTHRTDTAENIVKAVESEITFYKEFLADYFKNATSISYLDKLLNEKPGSKMNIAYGLADCCYLGLIVAKLNHNHRFQELAAVYREIIMSQKGMNEAYKTDFELLVTYLQTLPD